MSRPARLAAVAVVVLGVAFLTNALFFPGSSTDALAIVFVPLYVVLAIFAILFMDAAVRTVRTAVDFFRDPRRL